MSEGPTAAGAARHVGSGTAARLTRAWRTLPHESRLAAFASLALFLTLFLPWYQVTLIAREPTETLQSASASITGWGAFSFVEAAILLVAAGVLTLLFQRSEGHAFHLPGGDGGVITAAGVWTCALIVWRIFDKQAATAKGPSATSSGVEWGIFVALAAGAFLAYSGSRIRAAHRPEPPLPGEDGAPAGWGAAADTTTEPRRPESRRRESRPREPRRRARPPQPVAAEPPRPRRDRPAVPPDPVTDATPVRVRRRASAEELFERVIPEDPPAMRFGRIPPPNRPSLPAAKPPEPPEPPESPEPASADDQLTIAFREDKTLPLGNDKTLLMGEDETLQFRRRPEH